MQRVLDYREKAAALRDRAQATKDKNARAQLVEIAMAYEELAEQIEAEGRKRKR